MSLEKFLDFIINRRLTFSRLSEFEDKTEAYETADFLRPHATSFIEDLQQKGASERNTSELIDQLSCASSYDDVLAIVNLARKLEMPSIDADVIFSLNAISEKISRPMNTRWYCACFSAKPTEDYLLWSAYTRGRVGVCVEFSQDALTNQLNYYGYCPDSPHTTQSFSELALGEIHYTAEFSNNPSSDEKDYVFTKSDHFSGEIEYRIAGRVSQFGLSSPTFHMPLSDISNTIRGISISPFYSKWEADAVEKAIRTIWASEYSSRLKIVNSEVGKIAR